MLLTALRYQAETYVYGLPPVFQNKYDRLKQKLNEHFGHVAMKESYIAEAKLRRKQSSESFRDFGQAVDLKTSSEGRILTIHKLHRSMRSKLSLTNVDSQRTFVSLSRELD